MKLFHFDRAGALGASLLLAAGAFAQPGPAPQDSLAMQQARSDLLAGVLNARFYPADAVPLGDLPPYVPEASVSGTVRLAGSDMFGGPGLRKELAEGFRRFQPGADVQYNFRTNLLAVCGLLDGTADIGITHALTWETLLAFERTFGYDPLTIAGVTGWMVEPAFEIAVNADNPIRSLSMRQLDGIYGAARSGGWVGTSWHPDVARTCREDIRTWGQAGLGGEWANRPIHPYAYSIRCMFGLRFSDAVLSGSDKWSEEVREVFNATGPDGKLVPMDVQMANLVSKDPAAIAFLSSLRVTNPRIRILPIGVGGGAPVQPRLENVRDHAYPLADSIYFYMNRRPGAPLDPKVREFMRFFLSREGQEAVVHDGKMLPLTAEQLRQERAKL
jgi:phosphate transport system substrate-binding protein